MGNGNHGQGWNMGDGMGWGGWLMMAVFLIACLAILGGLLYVLVRGSRSGATPAVVARTAHPTPSGAEATLDERFARGEIDEPEYRSRIGALRTR
jgi:putative membrane protein